MLALGRAVLFLIKYRNAWTVDALSVGMNAATPRTSLNGSTSSKDESAQARKLRQLNANEAFDVYPVRTLWEFQTDVLCCSWQPTGMLIAAGSADGTVVVCDLGFSKRYTGTVGIALKGHRTEVRTIALIRV